MDIKEAREIDKIYREQMKMPIAQRQRLTLDNFVPTMEFKRAQGYIEAHDKEREKAKGLIEALNKAQHEFSYLGRIKSNDIPFLLNEMLEVMEKGTDICMKSIAKYKDEA